MSRIKFSVFCTIIENVIGGEDKFKKKSSKDFQKKIADIANKLPQAFKHQADLEKHVADTIEKLQKETNNNFTKYKLILAPILKEYHKDFFIPLLFFFLEDGDLDSWGQEEFEAAGIKNPSEYRDEVMKLIREHGREFLKAVQEYKTGLDDLKTWANAQTWPTGKDSLNRFTKFAYVYREADDCLNGLQKLIKKAGK